MKNLQLQKVRQLISKDKLNEAFNSLEDAYLKEKKSIPNPVVLLRRRFYELDAKEKKGVVSYADYNVEKNKISNNLLEFVEKINSSNVESKKTKTNSYLKYLIVATLLILTPTLFLPKFIQWKMEKEYTEALATYSDELEFFGGILSNEKCSKVSKTEAEQMEFSTNSLRPYNNASRKLIEDSKELVNFMKSNENYKDLSDNNDLKLLQKNYQTTLDNYIESSEPLFKDIRKIGTAIEEKNRFLLNLCIYSLDSPDGNQYMADRHFKNVLLEYLSKNTSFKIYDERGCPDDESKNFLRR